MPFNYPAFENSNLKLGYFTDVKSATTKILGELSRVVDQSKLVEEETNVCAERQSIVMNQQLTRRFSC